MTASTIYHLSYTYQVSSQSNSIDKRFQKSLKKLHSLYCYQLFRLQKVSFSLLKVYKTRCNGHTSSPQAFMSFELSKIDGQANTGDGDIHTNVVKEIVRLP